MFNPACLYCGVRLLIRLGKRNIGVTECRERRQAMLKVWTDWGHDEQHIRTLFRKGIGLEPVMESERPSKKKRR